MEWDKDNGEILTWFTQGSTGMYLPEMVTDPTIQEMRIDIQECLSTKSGIFLTLVVVQLHKDLHRRLCFYVFVCKSDDISFHHVYGTDATPGWCSPCYFDIFLPLKRGLSWPNLARPNRMAHNIEMIRHLDNQNESPPWLVLSDSDLKHPFALFLVLYSTRRHHVLYFHKFYLCSSREWNAGDTMTPMFII